MDTRMQQLGFVQYFDVENRYSIAELIPKSKPRCGIYLLEFKDTLCYVGQAVDVVRRFTQHRNRYDDIIGFYFKPISKKLLNEIEKSTIFDASSFGVQLINRDHVAGIIGDADLDSIISPTEQDEWLLDASKHQTLSVRVENTELRIAHHKQYQQFQKRSDSKRIINILREYVRNTIPSYRKTEMSFWALSCFPSTNISTWPRIACCSINTMETFVIGYLKNDPTTLWALLNVAVSVIGNVFPDVDQFYEQYPDTELEIGPYKAAGNDQVTVHLIGVDHIEKLLSDGLILSAASLLNLNVMCKGATVNWKAHCFDLADHIV